MDTRTLDERMLSELDHARIRALVPRGPRAAVSAPRTDDAMPFDDVLDAADLVPSREVPPDLVTMYSRVLVADPATGERRTLTPCYPADTDPTEGFVSVLSPVGMALLGLRVGAVAQWRAPGGEEGAAEVVSILFQPEASGDYKL
ncbi:MAG: GreA/GreB family elongation factor [Burkholderiaceae bacterium]